MAPAQPLTADDEGGKPKIVVKLEEADGDCKQKKDQNGSGLVCHSNFEDSGFYGDSTTARDSPQGDAFDQEVDVVGFGDTEVAEAEKREDPQDPDATEHSSSFGNTFSGSEEEARMSSSDMEVDSQFSVENGEQPAPAGFGRLFKKKKVTGQWQRFISPLTWRCQWLELRMNELRSQALLYDKELEAYKREKQLQSKMIELDDSVSRSVPLACQRHRNRAMKRRKRKRIEDTDTLSYMKKHSVFSYYGENNRSETHCQAVKNDCDNQEVEDDKNGDGIEAILQVLNHGDSSLEKILLNLDNIQTRVLSLRSQLSDVMKRNPVDVSSSAANFFPGDPPISYARRLSCSPGNNGDAVQHHRLEYALEVPGSPVSSDGDVTDVDVMEGSTCLFSSDAPLHQRRGKYLYEDVADDVLINNQAAEEELKNFEKGCHSGAKPEAAKEEAQSCSEDAKTTPRAPAATAAAGGSGWQNGQPSTLKPCYTGKKRGRKPKRKRRGGCISGLKSERIQRRRIN